MSVLQDLGIAVCYVTYGRAFSFGGAAATVAITVEPRAVGLTDLNLTWLSSGDIFTSFTDSVPATLEGGSALIELPQTAQEGFYFAGVRFKDWYYHAEVTAKVGSTSKVRRYDFQIPAGTTAMDLDLLATDQPLPGAPTFTTAPSVLSVAGFAGVITKQQLAAAGVGGGYDAGVDY